MPHLRLLIGTLIALFVLGQQGLIRPALAEVVGNTYTSPQLEYIVTWDDTWFVVSDSSAEVDELSLTNGLTYCYFIGLPGPAFTPELGLAGIISGGRTEPAISDFAPLVDENGDAIRGSDIGLVFAAFTYTFTDVDGTTYPLARYIEVRSVVPGTSVVVFTCEMAASDFESERPVFEALLGRLVLPNEQPEPEQAKGEPAPVFVSGSWRIAVATTALARAFPELGLKEKANKEWMIVIVDVTNWSAEDSTLRAKDFTIIGTGDATIGKIARSSMRSIAEQLGVEPFADDLTMPLAAGASERVALAFVLPERSPSPSLVHGEVSLPLTSTIEVGLPAELPALPMPAELREGEIVSASDGRTMRVLLDGRARAIRVQLLGVEPPAEGECAEHAAEKVLDTLVGAEVLVEEDSAIVGGSIPGRYVWLINDDGSRTLLNQRLIAEGTAFAMEIPSDSRFGLWLAESEQAAMANEVGLWADCPASSDTNESGDGDSREGTPVAGLETL